MDISDASAKPLPARLTAGAANAVCGLVSSGALRTPVMEVMRLHAANDESEPRTVPRSRHDGPLWDAASGRFHPVRLRAAIVARGWTVGEFAVASGVSRACMYNALHGLAVSDRTVIRIVAALEMRSASGLIDG